MNILSSYNDNDIYFHYAYDEYPNPEEFPMHAHGNYELFIFINGKGHYSVEGIDYQLKPLSILVIRPLETHKLYINPKQPYERISLCFNETIIKTIDPQMQLLTAFNERPLGKNNYYKSTELSDIIIECIKLFRYENKTKYRQKISLTAGLFFLLESIDTIYNEHNKNNYTDTITDTSLKIVDYINNHLFDNITLSSVSKKFFLSKSQIERIFKATTGSSLKEYILLKRLIEVRRRILLGEKPTIVSKECGFYDYSSFFRLYKKRFNIAPSKDKNYNIQRENLI